MKVVLQQDIKGTGKKDELVNVSDGYARNYLIPRGLAIVADSAAMSKIKSKNEALEHRKAVELDNAKQIAAVINGNSVKIEAKAGSAPRKCRRRSRSSMTSTSTRGRSISTTTLRRSGHTMPKQRSTPESTRISM